MSAPRLVGLGLLLVAASCESSTAPTPCVERIAFATGRDDADPNYSTSEIYVMAPDGSDARRLTQTASSHAYNYYPAWSPDGGRIAFYSLHPLEGNSGDVYTVAAGGGGVVPLTSAAEPEDDPAWSPDGTKIAFRFFHRGYGASQILVMDANGGGVKPLAADTLWSNVNPAWSPDGSKIAFSSNRDGNYEIYVMNADGGDPTRLTNSPAVDRGPAWSPDGTRIAFWSNRDGNYDLYVMPDTGGSADRITTDTAFDGEPAWSPDGTRIAFYSSRGGTDDIWVVTLASGALQNLTNTAGWWEGSPAWLACR